MRNIQEICKLIQEKGSLLGNVSFRGRDSFKITKSGAPLESLTETDFVNEGDGQQSCEVKVHKTIYLQRPDVNWIIHLHDDVVLRNPGNIPTTEKEQKFGTQQLADEVGKTLGQHNYMIIKNHGIIALGSSLDEVIDLVIHKHNVCKNH